MPTPEFARRKSFGAGFSLLELVIVVAVVGLLSTMVANMTGRVPLTVANQKLQSDVNLLNQMVGLFVADGGSLNGLATPQAVIDALKRSRTMDSQQTYTGTVSGRLVDIRLRARTGSGSVRGGSLGRAVWDGGAARFRIVADGSFGADEFYLDESLASADFGSARRQGKAVSFNKSNGWVWGSTAPQVPASEKSPDYVDSAGTDTYFNPMELASGGGSGSGGGSSGGSGSSGGGGGGGGTSQGGGPGNPQLPAPAITPTGGSYNFDSFPTTITISDNGAPSGESKLVFQQNHGAWQDYIGSLAIQSGDVISAQNVSLNPAAYVSSTVTSAEFYRLVSSIGGSETASWTAVTGGSNLVQSLTTNGATVTLTHGNTQLDLGGGDVFDAGTQNVISFTQTAFADLTPDAWFKLGDVTMLNGTTFYDSEATGATLRLAFALSEPASTAAATVDIQLGFINNENSSDSLASADAVEIKSPTTGTVFTSGGVNYRLELQWMSLDPAAGVVQDTQLLVYEGATSHAELRARFVADR